MGVFPLADTMNFIPNHPCSHGGTARARTNGRSREAWWQAQPMTTSHRQAAAHSPIHYIARIVDSPVLTPCPVTGRPTRTASAGRYIRRALMVRTTERAVESAAERGPPSATSPLPAH